MIIDDVRNAVGFFNLLRIIMRDCESFCLQCRGISILLRFLVYFWHFLSFAGYVLDVTVEWYLRAFCEGLYMKSWCLQLLVHNGNIGVKLSDVTKFDQQVAIVGRNNCSCKCVYMYFFIIKTQRSSENHGIGTNPRVYVLGTPLVAIWKNRCIIIMLQLVWQFPNCY